MSWDFDKEPRRAPGPSKAELQRQLEQAVRNTALPADKREAPAVVVPKPAPSRPLNSFAHSPSHQPKRIEPLKCESCGGPRSQYSSARCRACYRGMRPDDQTKVVERLRARRKELVERAEGIADAIAAIDRQLEQIDTSRAPG